MFMFGVASAYVGLMLGVFLIYLHFFDVYIYLLIFSLSLPPAPHIHVHVCSMCICAAFM